MTPFSKVYEFLDTVENQGFIKKNTVTSRRVACNKLLSALEDENKNAEYVRDNIDKIKIQYQNKNRDIRGATVNQYANRISLVLKDFFEWTEDQGAWEKKVTSKGSSRTRVSKAKEKESTSSENHQESSKANTSDCRELIFPLRRDFELPISIPKEGITQEELKKIGLFLMPYCSDLQTSEMQWPGIVSQ